MQVKNFTSCLMREGQLTYTNSEGESAPGKKGMQKSHPFARTNKVRRDPKGRTYRVAGPIPLNYPVEGLRYAPMIPNAEIQTVDSKDAIAVYTGVWRNKGSYTDVSIEIKAAELTKMDEMPCIKVKGLSNLSEQVETFYFVNAEPSRTWKAIAKEMDAMTKRMNETEEPAETKDEKEEVKDGS